jgi:TolA-binding protein
MAVGLEYGSQYPEDTVFKVIRKGYISENMVLRPAEVIISKRPYESTKVKKAGIWKQFISWMSPSKRRFAVIDPQMDELKQAQNQKNLILQQEIERLQDFIAQSGAEREKMDELCQIQGEKIEQLEQEIETLRDLLTEADADYQKTGDDEPVPDEDAGKDQTDEDDESVFYYDTNEDQKTDDDEPVMDGDVNDDYKKYP